MADWKPRLVFSSVNKKVAWRLLVPMMLVTGISGIGAKEMALPNLWQAIPSAIEKNVQHGVMSNLQPSLLRRLSSPFLESCFW